MIQVLYIEEVSIEEVDALIEKGIVFDLSSKATLLPSGHRVPKRDAFWGKEDKQATNLRDTNEW